MALFSKISEGDGFYIGANSDFVLTRFDGGEAELDLNDGGQRRIIILRPRGKPYWYKVGCRLQLEDFVDGTATFRFDADKGIKIDKMSNEHQSDDAGYLPEVEE